MLFPSSPKTFAPAETRFFSFRKVRSPRTPVAAAIIAATLLIGAARAETAPPDVSSAMAVIELPGASPLELAPYQSKTDVNGSGRSIVALSAEKVQALLENIRGTKGVKILKLPAVTTPAGQQATVSSGKQVNLSGNATTVFAGVTIQLTPRVSPVIKDRKVAVEMTCQQGQVFNQGKVFATSVITGAGAVRDGQTLVLDGPAAGDADRHILVFVTPRLVDAAGKPLYPNPYP